MSGKIKNKYSPENLETLGRMLDSYAQSGDLLGFEVMLNGHRIILKTDDTTRFEEIYDHLNTERDFVLVVRVFEPRSQVTRYVYNHQIQREQSEASTLQGISAHFDQKLSQHKLQWDHDLLKQKAEDLLRVKNDLESERRKLAEELEETRRENEELRSRKLVWGDVNLGEVASVVLEGMVRRNAHLLAKNPMTAGLAGLIEEDNQNSPSHAAPEQDPETEAFLQICEGIKARTDPEGFVNLMQILDELTNEPGQIPHVMDFLGLAAPVAETPNIQLQDV